jgi:membrane fusion protein (multidrug efflux system)
MPKDFDANPPRYQPAAEAPDVAPQPPQAEVAPARPADAPADSPAEPKPRRRGPRRAILGLVAVLALGGIGWYGHDYWTVGRFMVETDDAYVQADFTVLAPKVGGYVAAVPVQDNAAVRAGEPLVVLEDGDYRDALRLAQAQLDAQQAALARIDSQAAAGDASIDEARARVEAAKATLAQADADLARYRRLASNDVATAQRLEAAQAADTSAAASVREAEAGVATAQANRAVTTAERAEAEAMIAGLEAQRDRAERDLGATVLRAPFDGTVGNLSVAVGDLVAPGKRLLAVVPLGEVYVEANFKETQIAELAPGTEVHLHFDAFPDRDVVGSVEGIAPASGAQFSLLPPENATGNFTTVVQRLPVRIRVPAAVAGEGWLRPGLSVQASADRRTSGEAPATVAAR